MTKQSKTKPKEKLGSIGFVWQGISGRYGVWNDGLRVAMRLLEEQYDVSYLEPHDNLDGFDVLLHWEAPCTINGKDSHNYNRVRLHPTKKILLFAGGPIQKEWVDGYDLVCVESEINLKEFQRIGVPVTTAFGINDEIMKPKKLEKKWKVMHHGTCASWKRQWLPAEAFGSECLLVGRFQQEDSFPFTRSRELGAEIKDESGAEDIAKYLNQTHVLVQSSDYWGGGQRATLEALACGIPVVCMTDSPKNREYIEESLAGLVVEPNAQDIRRAVNEIIENWSDAEKARGVAYVKSKWTAQHYADSLDFVIKKLSN